ncbi:choice-of-anchor J domain-containing protein [Carboxylicivirga sp. RSCT41]|uniref:choice-of-anchor J domain-containing protein n=1 Tax=Carboxylicivirga agarovorans TaxID=3417570 RepID=UPI003D3270E1
MKKILKYIPVLLVLLYACDPMDDVYTDLDKAREPYNEAVEFMMTADDYKTVSKQALKDATNAEDTAYAKAVESDMSFNQKYTDLDYMKYVLHANYIALGKNSVANVEYNSMDKPEDLMVLEGAEQYRLSKDDYALVEEGVVAAGEGFYPGYEAETYLPAILAAGIESPEEGDIVRANYKYYFEEPQIGYKAVFTETFDDETLGEFTSFNIAGEDLWFAGERYGDFVAEASGYGKGACEDWLVSSEIDLSDSEGVTFQINQYVNYLTSWDDIAILISTDYSGDVNAATWEEIVVTTKPEGTNHDYVLSEMVDISAYEGQTCFIAFKYVCSADAALRWRLNDINVFEKGISGEYDTREIFYEYNGGEWTVLDDSQIISYSEYEMFGSPGKYHNFSTSDEPENYLPTYLQSKYPYAQEGDVQFVGYKYYYSGSTGFKVSKYMFTEGMWSSESSGPFVTVTNQFVHNGTTWVFDPTIAFTMGKSDYQLVVDYVRDNISEDYAPYSDGEYYYGASGRYTNFDLRIKNRTKYDIPTGIEGKTFEDLSEEEALEVIWDRLPEGIIEMLKAKYPEATTQVGGVDVYYEVEFKTYENDLSSNFYTYKFKCTKSGPNPEFDFIEDITPEN